MRIKISMQLNERSLNKKLMVFQEGSWEKIEDLENHVKRVFNLGDLQLELYIDGFWIPSSENICIIGSTDEVIVKEAPATLAIKSASPNKVTSHGESIKKESNISKDTLANNDSASEELLTSIKRKLLSKVVSLEEDEMGETDFGAIPPKRKRKRRHKKSSKIPLLAGITPDFQQYPPSAPASAERHDVSTLRAGHIRFDNPDEEMDSAVPNSQDNEKLEDWQQKLLSLAQERDKLVFTRQPFTNGMNGEAHLETETIPSHSQSDANDSAVPVTDVQKQEGNSSDDFILGVSLPMESPKTSDLMYFKKLIMHDSISTVSDFMLAVVEEIGDENVLTLKICEGHTEESFSAEELQESEGDSFIVKLDWSKILEPRLVTKHGVLSVYL